MKKNFLAGLEIPDFSALNPAARQWLDTIANARVHGETKTNTQTNRFAIENAKILQGREMPLLLRQCYKARRLALMLAQRRFSYVTRGIWKRLSGRGGDFY